MRISAHDPNATAINIGAALIGLLFLLIPSKMGHRKSNQGIRILGGSILVLILIPALISTMSRAAIGGLVLTTVIFSIILIRQGRLQIPTLMKWSVVCVIFTIAIYGVSSTGRIKTLDTVYNLYQFSMKGEGKRSLTVKTELWSEALLTIWTAPLFGIGNMNAFRERNKYEADIHNTYLDFGVFAGLPALFIFIWIITLPLRKIKRLKIPKDSLIVSMLAVYTYCLITIFFISVPGNKVLWIIWTMLFVVAFNWSHARQKQYLSNVPPSSKGVKQQT
jgi:O-antigen ligase